MQTRGLNVDPSYGLMGFRSTENQILWVTGFFDGLKLGHAFLLRKLLELYLGQRCVRPRKSWLEQPVL